MGRIFTNNKLQYNDFYTLTYKYNIEVYYDKR